MVLPLDSYFLLWIIGIWQPITAEEIHYIISEGLREKFDPFDEKYVYQLCQKYTKEGLLVRVHRNPSMYSLSEKGHASIPEHLRRSKDKKRLFLLRDTNRVSLGGSYDGAYTELGDATSSMKTRVRMQSSETRSFASVVPTGQTVWSRYFKQLFKTGKQASSYDILSFPEFLSFYELAQIPVARGIRKVDPKYSDSLKIDERNLALMLGISAQLIESILKNKRHYYRRFPLPKKTGGTRLINGPRVFLKVIQRFLLDYYLNSLRVHSSVNSFIKSKSVFSNAQTHKGKAFVGTIDIEDFFGSISTNMVKKILKYNGYDESEIVLIEQLCTLNGVLPQGAPTSPILSNALLYDFDEKMDNLTKKQGLSYSRYADDLTISGEKKEKVSSALNEATLMLCEDFSLKINENKTRIVSFNGRQVVTGLVVNEKIQPPRYKRHQIRAAFHNASTKGKITKGELNKLRGYYGYLSAAPILRDTQTLNHYKQILLDLSKKLTE